MGWWVGEDGDCAVECAGVPAADELVAGAAEECADAVAAALVGWVWAGVLVVVVDGEFFGAACGFLADVAEAVLGVEEGLVVGGGEVVGVLDVALVGLCFLVFAVGSPVCGAAWAWVWGWSVGGDVLGAAVFALWRAANHGFDGRCVWCWGGWLVLGCVGLIGSCLLA